ncbi:hypothetical protein DKX38_014356 [Salix brachista]|uniref:Cytochrome P450 n=1 Tax=Salix brachista TaxID=2182728 RepID=A0A5N5LFI0_9ROSI|nr:hypothetical protein DKX38_014356 [Salix brachista]
MFGFAPYGRYWRDIRKLVMVELLSSQRLELLKHVRDFETSLLMKELYDKSSKNGGQVIVEVKQRLADMVIDIIFRMISGKRYFSADAKGNQETTRCQETVRNFFYLAGLNLASDAVPLLGWLDLVKGFIGKMKRTARELDSVLGSWVNEHRRIRLNRSINEEEKDFIHVMLSIMDDSNISVDEADTTVKATCLVVHLTLARLLHGFELRTVSDTPVDMTESPGLTVPKAAPLEVVLRPRLPPVAYKF